MRRILIRCIAPLVCAGFVMPWVLGSKSPWQAAIVFPVFGRDVVVQWNSKCLEFDHLGQSVSASAVSYIPPHVLSAKEATIRQLKLDIENLQFPQFAGFKYGSARTGDYQFVTLPLYFPSILSALALVWVWYKTKHRSSATAFPVEPKQRVKGRGNGEQD